MEDVFSDVLGLFGAEIEEDDGYVHYGGLKLGIVPKARLGQQLSSPDRPLIVDGIRMCAGGQGM
jgi:hypothetical protein